MAGAIKQSCSAPGAGYWKDIYSQNHTEDIHVNLTSTSSDSNLAFSVLDFPVWVNGSGEYRVGNLYIGEKNTASPSYYGDLPIAHVQIVANDGTYRSGSLTAGGVTAVRDYDFAFSGSTYGYSMWATTYHQLTSNPALSTTDPSAYALTSIGSGAYLRRWRRVTGTSSSYVGANNGIFSYGTYRGLYNSPYTSGGTILPKTGSNLISQQSSGYLMAECSGSSTNDVFWMRSPTLTIYNGDRIKIAYLCTGPTNGTGLKTSNTLWFRFK